VLKIRDVVFGRHVFDDMREHVAEFVEGDFIGHGGIVCGVGKWANVVRGKDGNSRILCEGRCAQQAVEPARKAGGR
jgi:hypothetical protein